MLQTLSLACGTSARPVASCVWLWAAVGEQCWGPAIPVDVGTTMEGAHGTALFVLTSSLKDFPLVSITDGWTDQLPFSLSNSDNKSLSFAGTISFFPLRGVWLEWADPSSWKEGPCPLCPWEKPQRGPFMVFPFNTVTVALFSTFSLHLRPGHGSCCVPDPVFKALLWYKFGLGPAGFSLIFKALNVNNSLLNADRKRGYWFKALKLVVMD